MEVFRGGVQRRRMVRGGRKHGVSLVLALLFSSLLALSPQAAFGDEQTHKYVAGEEVVLWTNKVGPYNNPQETFNYFTLPFCKAVSHTHARTLSLSLSNECHKAT